ncbi:MAG: ATP-dependent DNA ligase [Myxococcales bacterium]|nr:ATP-dependent DNA ligase [Myxococcales bacterium]MBL0194503.1 ATP-dependent DNA ligase [Myxococcales bacterium]
MSALLAGVTLTPYAGGQRGAIGALRDASLVARLQRYRMEVAKRYRVITADELAASLPRGKAWLSTKLDGELWFLVKRGAEVVLASFNGRVLSGTPLAREAAARLEGSGDAIYAGELTATPPEGRPRVQHVGAALADETLEPRLRFFAFDVVEQGEPGEGAEDGARLPYEERLAILRERFGAEDHGGRVALVTTVAGTGEDALAYYREWVTAQRFEGLVLRSEVGLTYKIKPFFTVDAVIVAYGARLEGQRTVLREITVALRRDDGTLQLLGPVGTGFSEDDRATWLTRLAAMEVPSAFRMANRDGTLCRFVRPEIVVEVKLSDLVETDANDVPVVRMTLAYDASAGYAPRGDAPIAAMLFPTFLRERTDKTPDVASVGMTQITSRLALDPDARAGGLAAPAPAEVLRRGVWVKGATAVRKFALLATHKEPRQGFPRFLVYGTDFSGGRAEPLKTSLRTASTLEKAEQLVAAWLEDNVKRGWLPAGEGAAAEPAPAPAAPKKAAKKAAAPAADSAPLAAAPAEPGATEAAPPKKKPRKKSEA